MSSEQKIQSKIIKYLKSKNFYVVNVISAGAKGTPDLLACIGGKFCGIEVKRPTTRNNTTKLQEAHLRKIKEAAGFSCVATSVEEVEDFVEFVSKI